MCFGSVWALLTRPVRRGIHTPVRRGMFRLSTAHRWAQMADQSEIWLEEKKKKKNQTD